jgi:hypothetical protein
MPKNLQLRQHRWPYLALVFHVARTIEWARGCSCEVRYGIRTTPSTALWAAEVLAVVSGQW